ncbi:MAG: hypothetical protein JWN44_6929 [Myxococcales bacterium]|nr:hypothetical protein [Myxococcales bacterium]
MLQLQSLLPALGAEGQHAFHAWMPLVLILAVAAVVIPLAYILGKRGGRPDGSDFDRQH